MDHGPEEFLSFLELRPFVRRWADLGLDDERDLADLQVALMRAPTGAPVVKGSRGIRKMRFAPAAWDQGKRGAVRVLYAYFPAYRLIVLCVAYGKNEKGSISAAELKELNKILKALQDELAALYGPD